jgi:GNAT superfamily N-acetyltransferase
MSNTPAQSSIETLRDGSKVTIRPILKEDVELERKFIEGLSPQSRRYRFLYSIVTPTNALLKQLTELDPQREAALIALVQEHGETHEIGVARFSSDAGGKAEVAVTVSDEWQNKGLGTVLMQRLIALARQRGIRELYSMDAADNEHMRNLAADLGFVPKTDPDDATQVIYTLHLQPA